MRKMFGINGPVYTILEWLWNMLVLNCCFILTCVPIFTMGAGITALYSVNILAVRNEDAPPFKSFWKSFRTNFKKSTLSWLVILAALLIWGLDIWALKTVMGDVNLFWSIFLTVILVIIITFAQYIFPYIARFEDTWKTSVKNAVVIGISNIGTTITIVMITLACIAVTFATVDIFLQAVFVWLILGFAALSYIHSYFLRRIFDKYAPGEEA